MNGEDEQRNCHNLRIMFFRHDFMINRYELINDFLLLFMLFLGKLIK